MPKSNSVSKYISVVSLIPTIIRYINILRPIILVVEAAYGPGDGETKRERVKAAAVAALTQIRDTDLPIDDKTEKLIDALISYIVDVLNASGEMDEATVEYTSSLDTE